SIPFETIQNLHKFRSHQHQLHHDDVNNRIERLFGQEMKWQEVEVGVKNKTYIAQYRYQFWRLKHEDGHQIRNEESRHDRNRDDRDVRNVEEQPKRQPGW
uniref:Uncharacterized protein n=1 Tax=Glossina palpalis gambiensis TaxID=67801 RepID=A0A1B0C2Q6_9MUSC